jgi:hypothetical protein
MLPRAGDVLHITRDASVQFTTPILFRVIRIHDWATYDGWIWLDGYELNLAGDAVERRSVFVQPAGLRMAVPVPAHRTGNPRNGQPNSARRTHGASDLYARRARTPVNRTSPT